MDSNNYLEDEQFSLIIEAYRKSLILRYSEEKIENFPDLNALDRGTIDKLIHYFLELLYPPYEERKHLDNAFQSLNNFVHSPTKLFGVIGNLPYAIMRFGKMLIQALQAGISALRSYLAAHKFERVLYIKAKPLIDQGLDISEEKVFNSLIAQIPKKDADEFREQVIKLFEVLSKRELLEKVQDVMQHVIEKMESKPRLYSQQEVAGIKLGYGIIEKGKELFMNLNEHEIRIILRGIDFIEKEFYESAIAESK
ncbi:MAG: hypothetical protein H7A24_11530 [Leptospiraceae bacterium]|nr:hypothetical protein [Leptospiraceae bacterium]MCP5512505.1 hypothetical protein [Leptospiraceae bacterium]